MEIPGGGVDWLPAVAERADIRVETTESDMRIEAERRDRLLQLVVRSGPKKVCCNGCVKTRSKPASRRAISGISADFRIVTVKATISASGTNLFQAGGEPGCLAAAEHRDPQWLSSQALPRRR